jgi:CheY-like chemotaxis protein
VCTSADQVLKVLQGAVQANDPYHFVLIDYEMEGTNGFRLVEQIKSSTVPLDAKLFMITALGHIMTSEQLTEKGFHGFLVKPCYPNQLKVALQILWLAKREGKTLPLVTRHMVTEVLRANMKSNAIHPEMFAGKLVLAVDDAKMNLMLIKKVLEKHGCIVSLAENGKKAVEMVRTKRFASIFMDCQMPEMDGFSATHLIREEEKIRKYHTPIIAITADAMIGDREKCLKAGMDDYLNKPYKPEQVTEMLEKWIQKNTETT